VVVPGNQVARFVKYVKELEKTHQIRIRSFGHAGDGNLHVYVCKDLLAEADWNRRLTAVMAALYQKARELGGQVSGEHGIGHAKKEFLRESVGDTAMRLMRGIKLTFDPGNILNPGKVCIKRCP
jgi:glycolate oxidase